MINFHDPKDKKDFSIFKSNDKTVIWIYSKEREAEVSFSLSKKQLKIIEEYLKDEKILLFD